MPFLIGTDEAGYGPNLGPLVVTGTLWKVPSFDKDLYHLLDGIISESKEQSRIAICDSKNLYQSSGSISALETSVLSLLGNTQSSWRQLVKSLGCPRNPKNEEVWLAGAKLKLPLKADSTQIKTFNEQFTQVCLRQDVQLVAVQTSTLFANQFNQSVADEGNKASVLTRVTLEIVNNLLKHTKSTPTKIICDKHGGRSKYAGVLQHHLTDQLVRVHEESLATSRYSWQSGRQKIQAEFNARGETSLPVAMASMVSKYVREVYMTIWNQFWLGHLPTLKPTKGYPQDAKRFMADIEKVCNQLNIPRESIWRCR